MVHFGSAFGCRRIDPESKLNILFRDAESTGEGAADEGGATREFLRLLMRDIHTSDVFESPDWNKVLLCSFQGEFILMNSNCF